VANAEAVEYAGRILATVSIGRAKAVIGLALDPERNGWCALVVSLRYCYEHWDHLLRAYNKSQEAARRERERAAKRREPNPGPPAGQDDREPDDEGFSLEDEPTVNSKDDLTDGEGFSLEDEP
jgi:hypothetical protein